MPRRGQWQVAGHDAEDEPEDERQHRDPVGLQRERKRKREAVQANRDEPDDENEHDDRVRPGEERLARLAKCEQHRTQERNRSGDRSCGIVRKAHREDRGAECRDQEWRERPHVGGVGLRCHSWLLEA